MGSTGELLRQAPVKGEVKLRGSAGVGLLPDASNNKLLTHSSCEDTPEHERIQLPLASF